MPTQYMTDMNRKRIYFSFLLISLSIVLTAQNLPTPPLKNSLQSTESQSVVLLVEKVNDSWQSRHKAECRGFWDNAAYFTGNQAAWELTGKDSYLSYSLRFAEYNHWCGATEHDKSKWQYKTYGEGMQHVLFADWQICFQIYIDLYKIEHRSERLARALEVMNYQARQADCDYWWWSDALLYVADTLQYQVRCD